MLPPTKTVSSCDSRTGELGGKGRKSGAVDTNAGAGEGAGAPALASACGIGGGGDAAAAGAARVGVGAGALRSKRTASGDDTSRRLVPRCCSCCAAGGACGASPLAPADAALRRESCGGGALAAGDAAAALLARLAASRCPRRSSPAGRLRLASGGDASRRAALLGKRACSSPSFCSTMRSLLPLPPRSSAGVRDTVRCAAPPLPPGGERDARERARSAAPSSREPPRCAASNACDASKSRPRASACASSSAAAPHASACHRRSRKPPRLLLIQLEVKSVRSGPGHHVAHVGEPQRRVSPALPKANCAKRALSRRPALLQQRTHLVPGSGRRTPAARDAFRLAPPPRTRRAGAGGGKRNTPCASERVRLRIRSLPLQMRALACVLYTNTGVPGATDSASGRLPAGSAPSIRCKHSCSVLRSTRKTTPAHGGAMARAQQRCMTLRTAGRGSGARCGGMWWAQTKAPAGTRSHCVELGIPARPCASPCVDVLGARLLTGTREGCSVEAVACSVRRRRHRTRLHSGAACRRATRRAPARTMTRTCLGSGWRMSRAASAARTMRAWTSARRPSTRCWR
jgi:hypothetical protein